MADREIKLKLGTRADSNLADPLDKLTAATNRAAEAEKKLQQTIKGRAGLAGKVPSDTEAVLGRAAGAAGGMLGGLGGALGAAAGPFAAAAAAYTSLATAAGKTADALTILRNGALTTAQKQDALLKEFVPGAESFLKLRDAVAGVTEKLRQLHVRMAMQELQQGYEREFRLADQAARADVLLAKNRGIAFHNVGFVAPPGLRQGIGAPGFIDRSTFQGDITYQNAQQLYPAKVAQKRAVAEAQAAENDLAASKGRLAKLEGERKSLADRMRKAQQAEQLALERGNSTSTVTEGRGIGDRIAQFAWNAIPAARVLDMFGLTPSDHNAAKNKVERTDAGMKALLAEQAVLNNEAQIAAEITRQKQLGLTAAEKESAVRKAGIAIERERLSILQAQEQRLTGQSQRLGRMSPAQRALGLQAARLAKAQGIGNLPPALKALVEGFAPQFAAKEYEKFGQTTAEYKAGVKEGFLEEGNLKDIREKIGKVQANVQVEVNLDEELLSKRIAENLNKFLEKLLQSINVKFEAEAGKLKTGQQLRNAQQ